MNIIFLIEEDCKKDSFSAIVCSSIGTCKYFNNINIHVHESKKSLSLPILEENEYKDYRYILLNENQIEDILNQLGYSGLQIDNRFVNNNEVWGVLSEVARKESKDISKLIYLMAKQLNENKKSLIKLFLQGYFKEVYHNIRLSDIYILTKLIKNLNR